MRPGAVTGPEQHPPLLPWGGAAASPCQRPRRSRVCPRRSGGAEPVGHGPCPRCSARPRPTPRAVTAAESRRSRGAAIAGRCRRSSVWWWATGECGRGRVPAPAAPHRTGPAAPREGGRAGPGLRPGRAAPPAGGPAPGGEARSGLDGRGPGSGGAGPAAAGAGPAAEPPLSPRGRLGPCRGPRNPARSFHSS